MKEEVPVRSSPRTKQSAPKQDGPVTNGTQAKKKGVSYKQHKTEDDDAYMEDADEDADDIYAADVKGRSKRKNDEYVEEESEDEVLPQPKRVAPRGRNATGPKVTNEPAKSDKTTAVSRKRKTPSQDSDDEEEEELPRKKPTTANSRAPKAKKADEPEDSQIQDILDSVATVRPPTPPPRTQTQSSTGERQLLAGATHQPSQRAWRMSRMEQTSA